MKSKLDNSWTTTVEVTCCDGNMSVSVPLSTVLKSKKCKCGRGMEIWHDPVTGMLFGRSGCRSEWTSRQWKLLTVLRSHATKDPKPFPKKIRCYCKRISLLSSFKTVKV